MVDLRRGVPEHRRELYCSRRQQAARPVLIPWFRVASISRCPRTCLPGITVHFSPDTLTGFGKIQLIFTVALT